MIDTAMSWLNQGMAVIPIGYRSKRPNTRFLPNGSWEKYKTELPTKDEIRLWFDSTFTNMAVVCGWQNLVIVDFDDLDAHDLWLEVYDGYADTYNVHTGRGVHYYFFVEEMPPHTMKWHGGEIKASGYCLIPPSVHPSGRKYVATNPDLEIMTIGSLSEIFPNEVLTSCPKPSTHPTRSMSLDTFTQLDLCSYVKTNVRLTRFFSHMRKTGDGWYTVQCLLHDDGNKWSGWINDNENRYGCHCCISGSMSIVDFYMALHSVSIEQALKELSTL